MTRFERQVKYCEQAVKDRQQAAAKVKYRYHILSEMCPVPVGTMIPHKGHNSSDFNAAKSLVVHTPEFTNITGRLNYNGWWIKGWLYDTASGKLLTKSASGFYTVADLATLGYVMED